MQVKIDNASERPIYQQIIDQVKRDITFDRPAKDEKQIELLHYNNKGSEK